VKEFRIKDQVLKKEYQEDFFEEYEGYEYNSIYDCYMPEEGSCNCHCGNPPCSWCTSSLMSPNDLLEETLNEKPEMFENILIYKVRESVKESE
jgi:hypothetical protein